MGKLVTDWVWKRRTHHGVTAPMCEPSFWMRGEDEDGTHGVYSKVATELAARATAEYERARTSPPAPAATKTKPDKPPPTKPAKHKPNPPETPDRIVDDHDEEDDEPTDPDWDEEDDDDEEDEEERAAIAARARAPAALSDEKRLRRLHASASLEAQTDKERFAARVIAAARGETEKPRFQIGGEISERPNPHRIQGFIDGGRIPQGLRGASFQAPMPTNTPPGRSPLHNRGGK